MSGQVDKMEAHEIKQMYEAGMSKKDIAYATDRSRPTIDKVLSGTPREADERADMHDRMLGPISSGCYDSNGEQALFEDPTSEWAERVEFLEKNIDVELLDS
jgi:hypothetical protein